MTTDWLSKASSLALSVRDFIGGQREEPPGELLEKLSPRDGEVLYRFGAGTEESADRAVRAAKRAYEDGRWCDQTPQFRKDALLRLAGLVERYHDELALRECLDVGKPIAEAWNVDVPMATAAIRFNAEAADKLAGQVYASDSSSLAYQLLRPMGVVAAIVGWNFPVALAASKVAPALAAGNSVVLKPSELTSLGASRLAELAIEAGIPPGVFNVVHGDAATGAALARHADVDLITFTGSTRTGKELMVIAGQSNMKRLLLECGGKAPNIVFADAGDLNAVAEAIVTRAFWNQGEVCTASSRLLVHDDICDELLALIVAKTAALRIGDPLNWETQFGALISRAHRDKVLSYIRGGEEQGAVPLLKSGGTPPCGTGFYVSPVIFDKVLPSHCIAQDEIFGPVLSVLRFRHDEEALQLANATIYGLSAIVWTRDVARAHRMACKIRAGWVVVNATDKPRGGPGENVIPIGGDKQSGLAVEGGMDGLRCYFNQTTVQLHV